MVLVRTLGSQSLAPHRRAAAAPARTAPPSPQQRAPQGGAMAAIELSPISEHFSESTLEELEEVLAETKTAPLIIDDQAQTVVLDSDIDDELLAQIVDHLEVHDAACTVYVPPDFEDSFKVGEHQVGSAHMLLLVLDQLKEEFSFDSEAEDDSEDEAENYENDAGPMLEDELDNDAFDLKEQQLRHLWELLKQGATTCISDDVCMFVTM